MTIRQRRHAARRRGMTLVELLLALALLGLMMVGVITIYNECMRWRAMGEAITERSQLMRSVLNRVRNELRLIHPYRHERSDPVFGNEREVSFVLSSPMPRSLYRGERYDATEPDATSDLVVVRYFIAVDEENLDEEGNPEVLGLYRETIRRASFTLPVPNQGADGLPDDGSGGGGLTGVFTGADADADDDDGGAFGGFGGLLSSATGGLLGGEELEPVQSADLLEVTGEVGQRQLISADIKYLRIRYSNGATAGNAGVAGGTGQESTEQSQAIPSDPNDPYWRLDWNNDDDGLQQLGQMAPLGVDRSTFAPRGVPQAIEITVGFEPDWELLLAEDDELASRAQRAADGERLVDPQDDHSDRYTIIVSPGMTEKFVSPLASSLTSLEIGGVGLQDAAGLGGGGTGGPAGGLFGGN